MLSRNKSLDILAGAQMFGTFLDLFYTSPESPKFSKPDGVRSLLKLWVVRMARRGPHSEQLVLTLGDEYWDVGHLISGDSCPVVLYL